MAKPAAVQRPAPRLTLVTPVTAELAVLADALGEALDATDVAAVLLRLPPADERALINRVKTLASIVQPKDVALLLDGRPDLVARSGADGAHLTGIMSFTAALDALKPARIAGCGGVHSRHDAMLAGERGADYVMFGEPAADGQRPSFQAIIERVEWWAEVFEIPCVGYAAEIEEVAALVAAGADFVAVGDSIWTDPLGPVAAIAVAAQRLTAPEAVP